MEQCKISNMYTLEETIAKDYLAQFTYPWEALAGIGDYIKELGKTLNPDVYEQKGEDIWVAKSAAVAPTACLNGPLIIDENAEIRHCAFIRGNAIVVKGTVVAGSITSNVKSDKTLVVVKSADEKMETGRKKFGAMLGDFVEVGCNSVLNPGTVIGPHTNIYPLSPVRGVVPPHSIYKNKNEIVSKAED